MYLKKINFQIPFFREIVIEKPKHIAWIYNRLNSIISAVKPLYTSSTLNLFKLPTVVKNDIYLENTIFLFPNSLWCIYYTVP